ncbi:acyl-CoA dehydrogenase family protein [Streptomyces sp. MUM 178J]|uniref:acyl-CoA dehydrogenase family protein n=1 Tax=Streptomyces sp. MUM 178J TaxID=2791991 RepID=UPI001F04F364|nr:acyl-CoA dehydrogenase family protein [Streptomyces sp. MUM 178J]WRQ82758.1 acyl-CoA dehydrogenase family protein [Streptomyces sp. MUM 178J]
MDFAFPSEDTAFRRDARAWLTARLPPGAPLPDPRVWERELGRAGWIGLGWPAGEAEYGNRRATLTQQVVWAEEYARSRAPARIGHIGENLLAPTLLAFGTPAQRDRFLPPIARGEELWCQGYSEPGAGSDLASLRTVATAVRDTAARDTAAGDAAAGGTAAGGTAAGDAAADRPSAHRTTTHHPTTYRITGQKIWTSLAPDADWCFVLARTTPGSRRHHGLSFLLVPMDQPGRIEVRPIRQMTGDADFSEVFFDGAHASADHLVGGEGNGWRVAMGLLALERGVSTLAQQIGFAEELARVVGEAVRSGTAARDPVLRDRLVRQWAELRTMRWNALRTLGGPSDPGAPSVAKLLWGGWRQRLGELAMAVRGPAAAAGPVDWSRERPYELDALQRLFLFSRADTIYGGSDEIQRTIIAERVLGLPREPR